MRINSKTARNQQQKVHHHVKNSSHRFFDLLKSPELLKPIEDLLPEYRERHFPPTETLSMFLAQALDADRSCQQAVNHAAVRRIAEGLTPLSASTGGYCKARKRLPFKLISQLVLMSGAKIEERASEEWLWKGRSVYLIDGTTMTMPDTPENQTHYPQQSGQKPGLGFPICRILGVVSLCSGAIINASVGRYNGKGGDEQSLLRGVLDTFTSSNLVVGDAFYGSYFLLASL